MYVDYKTGPSGLYSAGQWQCDRGGLAARRYNSCGAGACPPLSLSELKKTTPLRCCLDTTAADKIAFFYIIVLYLFEQEPSLGQWLCPRPRESGIKMGVK